MTKKQKEKKRQKMTQLINKSTWPFFAFSIMKFTSLFYFFSLIFNFFPLFFFLFGK